MLDMSVNESIACRQERIDDAQDRSCPGVQLNTSLHSLWKCQAEASSDIAWHFTPMGDLASAVDGADERGQLDIRRVLHLEDI